MQHLTQPLVSRGYTLVGETVRQISQVVGEYSFSARFGCGPENGDKDLLYIKGKLRFSSGKSSRCITFPLCIWLPETFPTEAPSIFYEHVLDEPENTALYANCPLLVRKHYNNSGNNGGGESSYMLIYSNIAPWDQSASSLFSLLNRLNQYLAVYVAENDVVRVPIAHTNSHPVHSPTPATPSRSNKPTINRQSKNKANYSNSNSYNNSSTGLDSTFKQHQQQVFSISNDDEDNNHNTTATATTTISLESPLPKLSRLDILYNKVEKKLNRYVSHIEQDMNGHVEKDMQNLEILTESGDVLEKELQYTVNEKHRRDNVGKRLEIATKQIKKHIDKNEHPNNNEIVDDDDIVKTQFQLHAQIMSLISQDNAINDYVICLSKALENDELELEQFVKYIRKHTREQFYIRATLNRALFVNAVNFVPGHNLNMYSYSAPDHNHSNNKAHNNKNINLDDLIKLRSSSTSNNVNSSSGGGKTNEMLNPYPK